MKNNAMGYPHPVLSEDSNDFTIGSFSTEIISANDNRENINLEIKFQLDCSGIAEMINKKEATVILRIICPRTSFREMYKFENANKTINVVIAKKQVSDFIDIQAMIIATKDNVQYKLAEFNKYYFENLTFQLRKGEVIAKEPGCKIKLDSITEPSMGGIVLVTGNPTITEMRVNYAKVDEENPALTEYIVIMLPQNEYDYYQKLRAKKYFKHGIERFLQASIVLPALIEGISKLRQEVLEEEEQYRGTIWGDSILQGLARIGVDDISNTIQSDFELANKLLGNVESDSINNLMEKMIEWSTTHLEDEDL